MAAPLAGWRLPLRLAWRDLLRYKGRSALAALLILLPVGVMAGGLTFGTTANISDAEQRAGMFKNARAYIQFYGGDGQTKLAKFPATGRVIELNSPPTAAQVSKQAGGVPVTAEITAQVDFAPTPGGPKFISEAGQYFGTDLHSPLIGDTVTVARGRLPHAADEIVITDLGRTRGLPSHGTVQMSGYTANQGFTTVTIVGVVHTRLPDILAAGAATPSITGAPNEFAVGGSIPFTQQRIDQWGTYGASVMTRDYLAPDTSGGDDSGEIIAVLTIATAFICVTAMLAAPAFAAGATRHRRTLGLIASNGGTRRNLRRVVYAQALLLGTLTAIASVTIGSIAGAVAARWYVLHDQGVTPPVDIRIGWLTGLVIVSTVASLVAALVPARSAGKTNLLAALRGQVSSRTVKKRWPTLGVVLVGLGALSLSAALAMSSGAQGDAGAVPRLLVVLGVPLFFGGSVLAVPYLLAITGHLARWTPLTARLAVRDVSRQRTRATASIGAILATVAVFSGVSVAASSVDQYEAKQFQAPRPVGSGAFDMSTVRGTPTDAQVAAAVTSIRGLTRDATPRWGQIDPSRKRIIGVPGQCTKGKKIEYYPSITVIDDSGVRALGLDSTQRSAVENGGVLVVGAVPSGAPVTYATGGPGTSITPSSIKNGTLTLPVLTTGRMSTMDSSVTMTSCSNVSVRAAGIGFTRAWTYLNVGPGDLVMTRSTASTLRLPVVFEGVSINPDGGIDAKLESQLEALAPLSMHLQVEHGYSSPVQKVLRLIAAAFALVVLLTTVVSTLLNDAESQADAATLATIGAPMGMRRRVVGSQAFVLGFIGSLVGIVVGVVPGLLVARTLTDQSTDSQGRGHTIPGTYVVPWTLLLIMLIGVPLVAALISMTFARRKPTLTRRER